ncbi:MAG: thiolase domain-containing protein [Halobacteriota archaeon]
MREVAIVGIGCTKFGEMWDKSFRDLFIEAGLMALEDAGMSGADVEALYGRNMSSGIFIEQEHVGALIADYSGLISNSVPSTRVEAACASGGLALRSGVIAVASEYHDIVISAGIEKMTDVGPEKAMDALAAAADREWEAAVGATFPGLYAMMARAHMNEFGTTREQLAQVAVKNHYHGSMNPKAQFRNRITIDAVISSPLVADPLRLFDCSPITDGAAAVILVPAERAREFTDTPIYVKAAAQASDTISLHDRRSLTSIDATRIAADRAFKTARLQRSNIDVAEVHDCFTIAEIMAIEDLAFFEKGRGGPATLAGETAIGSKIPINTSGGLKACGHPVGATGIKQAVEIVEQLRGDAGKRQVEGAEVGLTHNVGGTGGTVVVHILAR